MRERLVSSATSSIAQRMRRITSSTLGRTSSSGLTRGSRHKHSEAARSRQTTPSPEKRGMTSRHSPTKSTKQSFFIPHHFHPRRLLPVPPSDAPDDAMSGEAGPAPGASTLAGTDPRPAATVSLRTRGWYEGDGVGCPVTGYPDRKDVPQRHTDKAPMLSRTSRQRGEQNGGDDGRSQMIENIPRARVPVGMVHHPAGTSRATGQAMADIP